MSKSIVETLDADEQVQKRAQWEAFEFALLGDGDVEVTNGSHEDADDHTYTVHVEGGIPSDCECPAWEYQPGACKHMVAVAIREPVLEAATENQPVRADGGVTLAKFATKDNDKDACWCNDSDFPCFRCYLEGRRDLPGEGE
ncbi:SWIM zinc finger family protein [Haloarcula sp. JP-Z28]|uniref:SWIM zinc finger family protein n=1 Tax=Haloarcula sp. JP-Z28 TaxID=2716715 RepID=UPI0014053DEE|nr:SWIM zinc finger family protein [Haloarcula sp. JP-Z28]NHN65492.1 SWIM zinc finger family protein [Haloarcula sp. JP-Z28]